MWGQRSHNDSVQLGEAGRPGNDERLAGMIALLLAAGRDPTPWLRFVAMVMDRTDLGTVVPIRDHQGWIGLEMEAR